MSLDEQSMDLSVVIPVRNEEKNIPELVKRLTRVIGDMDLSYEIIFVTDLNTDNTLEVLRKLHEEDGRVKMIKLSNSFGQHIAALAGMDASSGAAVVLMDGDLQDYPEDIPKLRSRMEEGFDVVYGVKAHKNDSWLRNLMSGTFLTVLKKLSDYEIEHNTCMFRMMSRRTVDALCRFREKEQNLTGLVGLIGFPTDKVEVTSGERLAGETNYSFMRQINMAIGFLLSFSTKPLRMISAFGLLVSSLSFIYLVTVLLQSLVTDIPIQGWATIVSLILFLGGAQLLALGIVAEYITRIFLEAKNRPLYIVEEKLGELGD